MLRIMPVDDESNVTRAQKRTLWRSLHGENCGIEAFDDPRLALAIADYRMPPMDGVEFLERLRVMQPDAVRLVLSASSDVEALLAYDERAANRRLAEDAAAREAAMTPEEIEHRRLEAEEPGITEVRWGPAGEVLLDEGPEDDDHAPRS